MHLNPVGTVLPQWLMMRLRSRGRLRMMPRILPLMAVQRQTAASRSASPSSNGQHGSVGGTATLALIKPSTLAHTPSFSASREHLPDQAGVVGVGVQGVDGVHGAVAPAGACHMAKTTRLMARNSATEALLAIAAQQLVVDRPHSQRRKELLMITDKYRMTKLESGKAMATSNGNVLIHSRLTGMRDVAASGRERSSRGKRNLLLGRVSTGELLQSWSGI
ncbi:hypothetical protein EJB05_58073, partial [Eragrostis curvula]